MAAVGVRNRGAAATAGKAGPQLYENGGVNPTSKAAPGLQTASKACLFIVALAMLAAVSAPIVQFVSLQNVPTDSSSHGNPSQRPGNTPPAQRSQGPGNTPLAQRSQRPGNTPPAQKSQRPGNTPLAQRSPSGPSDEAVEVLMLSSDLSEDLSELLREVETDHGDLALIDYKRLHSELSELLREYETSHDDLAFIDGPHSELSELLREDETIHGDLAFIDGPKESVEQEHSDSSMEAQASAEVDRILASDANDILGKGSSHDKKQEFRRIALLLHPDTGYLSGDLTRASLALRLVYDARQRAAHRRAS